MTDKEKEVAILETAIFEQSSLIESIERELADAKQRERELKSELAIITKNTLPITKAHPTGCVF